MLSEKNAQLNMQDNYEKNNKSFDAWRYYWSAWKINVAKALGL